MYLYFVIIRQKEKEIQMSFNKCDYRIVNVFGDYGTDCLCMWIHPPVHSSIRLMIYHSGVHPYIHPPSYPSVSDGSPTEDVSNFKLKGVKDAHTKWTNNQTCLIQ